MPPPQLPRDAPVVDVGHPLEVDLRPVVRQEDHAAVLHGADGLGRQRADLHEPLRGHERLDHRAAAIAVPHRVAVLGDLLEEAFLLQLLHQRLARLEPVLPGVGAGVLRHPAVFVDHRHARQRVALPHREVVRVVARRHLHRARPERRVDERVGDDRQLAADDRQLHPRPDHVPVALVVRVHRHRGVAQHRLGPRRGHRHAGAVPHGGVLHVVELAVGLLVLHLEVRQRRPAARAPVDDVLVAVDEPLAVERHELAAHGARQARIQREPLARPVHRLAELAHLAGDRLVRHLHPVPHARLERLAPEVVPRLLLRARAASRPRSAWRCPRGRCRAATGRRSPASASSARGCRAACDSGRGPCAASR